MSTQEPSPLVGAPPMELRGACGLCQAEHHLDNDAELARTRLSEIFVQLERASDLAAERRALEACRGKMIGVLVGLRADGTEVTLRSFSGDLGGKADWTGWVSPIVHPEDTADLEALTLAHIRAIEEQMTIATAAAMTDLRASRRRASATLMSAMLDATRLTNAALHTEPLRRVFVGAGIPSGTATCGLPKLLFAANLGRIRPLAVAEAWWGPPYGARRHGMLDGPCARRCLPILGFLLCREGHGRATSRLER